MRRVLGWPSRLLDLLAAPNWLWAAPWGLVPLLLMAGVGAGVVWVVLNAAGVIGGGENEARSFMPEASELCCHGNWEIFGAGVDPQDGECARHQELHFGNPRACWVRLYYNKKVRAEEPEDLTVEVAVMGSEEEAKRWLSSCGPMGGGDPSAYGEMTEPAIGYGARAWDYSGEYGWGMQVAFYRENVAVMVWVQQGTAEERGIMVKSVDQAIRDRFVEYR